LEQLRAFSNVVNQPIALFFRPTPPSVKPLPRDFRTLPRESKIPISHETRKVIREIQDKQQIFIDLLDDKIDNEMVGLFQDLSDPERTAQKVREMFNITLEQQSSWNSEYTAFKEWRKILEKNGFLVFQYKMPVTEIRGFSISDKVAPVIITNKNDHIRSQIFTLFHELAHILFNNGGLCIPERWGLSGTDEVARTEIYCNHFSGAFLVPHDFLMLHRYLKDDQEITIEKERPIGGIAKSFWVSKEVIIRRLVIFNKIPKSDYQAWREARSGSPLVTGGGGGGTGRDIANECIGRHGNNYTAQVLNSFRKEKITYVDIATSLNIKTKYIPRLEKIVEG